MSKRFSVLDFGLFYTPVKMKPANFLGATLIVTGNHWIRQSLCHLYFCRPSFGFPPFLTSFQPCHYNLSLLSHFVPFCILPIQAAFVPVFLSVQLLCVIPVLFTLQGEPGSAVGYFCSARAQCSHKDRREAVHSHSISPTNNIVYTTDKAALASLEPAVDELMDLLSSQDCTASHSCSACACVWSVGYHCFKCLLP